MSDGPAFPAFLKIVHQPDNSAKASFLAEVASFTKALARIGALGTTLSGPWGLAVVGAGLVAGTLIDKLLGIGNEAEKAEKKAYDFSRGLDVLTLSAKQGADAMQQLADATKGAILIQGDYFNQQAAVAADSVRKLEERITTNQRIYDALKKEADANATNPFYVPGYTRMGELRDQLATDREALTNAQLAKANAEIAASQRAVTDALDAGAAATRRYATAVGELENQRRKSIELEQSGDVIGKSNYAGYVSDAEYRRRLDRLTREKDAAVKAANAAERESRAAQANARSLSPDIVGNLVTSEFGGSVTSKTRSAARNGAAGGATRSYHLTGQAIDFVPRGGVNSITKDQVREWARRNGIDLQELLGPGDAGHDDHWHIAFKKTQRSPEQIGRDIDSQKDKIARLGEFANDAATRVASIEQSFGNTPPAIARVTSAMDQLRDIADDIDQRVKDGLDPKIADALRAQIEQAKAVVSTGADQPFRDMAQSAREFDAVQRVLVDGQQVSAEVLERGLALQRDQGVVTEEQLVDIRAIVVQEKLRAAELAKQYALRQRDAQLIDDTQANVNSLFQDVARGGGMTSVGKALKRQFDLLQTSAIDGLTSTLFGDIFANAKDKALGFDAVKEASLDQAAVARRLSAALDELRVSAGAAATELTNRDTGPATLESRFDAQFGVKRNAIPGASAVVAVVDTALGRRPANDNADKPITVTAGYQPRAFLGKLVEGIADIFVAPATAKRMGEGFAKGLSGDAAAYGSIAGGLVLGGSNSRLGSAIGGAVGEAIGGKALSKGLAGIAKGLGDFGGPLASIAGGIIGSVIGGLFTKTPKASSTIGTGADGTLQVVSTHGTSNALRQASSKSATEALDTLDRIAEALGANIDASAGRVSIGVRKGNYRVDTTGSGITKVGKGAIDFGEDSAAAIKYATLDLIKDGVLTGLRASTQRILQQGTDLDRAIQKAVDFESVFSRLKEYRDPVGAALDTLDKGFVRLQTVFKEAGASAAEYADLEALYALDRAKAIDEANQRVVGSLKSLLSDLNIGDTGLSLRDREAAARAAYDPLAARVRAGDVTANDAYAEAAQKLLDIERQIYGSQQGYFDFRNEVKTISQAMVDAQEALATASANRDSPFSTTTSAGTDSASVVSAIDNQTSALIAALGGELSAVNDNLISILKQSVAGGSLAAGMGFGTTF